jgi:hypothetical protein
VLSGNSKNLDEMFFSGRLKNEIGQAFEHEITNHGGEIDIEILTVILKLLRVFNDPEIRILMQNSFEGFPPRRVIFLLFHRTVLPHFVFVTALRIID